MDTAERAELLLVPLDPQLGIRRLITDLGRFSGLDPKLRAATALLDERFRSFSDADQELLSAVLWAYLRPRLANADNLPRMQDWLRDGATVLEEVEAGLETTLSAPVLQQLVEAGRGYAAAESTDQNPEFRRALDEVRSLEAVEIVAPVAVGFLLGYGAASLYCDLHGC